jgi:hypothetical protein
MKNNKLNKMVLLVGILVISLVLGGYGQSMAADPQPGLEGNERLVGPSTDGILIARYDESWGGYQATFVGTCNKVPVVLDWQEVVALDQFKLATAESIEFYRLPSAALALSCYDSMPNVLDLMVDSVKKFTNASTVVGGVELNAFGADVRILAVEVQ